ncbi:hypothetical protein V6N13_134953 [Hibiscus sabdariffa]
MRRWGPEPEVMALVEARMAQSVWRAVVKQHMLHDFCAMPYETQNLVADRVFALHCGSCIGPMAFDFVSVALAKLVRKKIDDT